MSNEEKERLRVQMQGNTFASRKWTKEEKLKMSLQRQGVQNNKGKKFSQEWIENMRKTRFDNLSNSGKIWITDGVKRTFILKDSIIPEGWKPGRGNYRNETQTIN